MKRYFFLCLLLILSISIVASAQDADTRYVGDVPAPEFPSDLDWINSENPLTLAGLRGKIILLDFWTYGCINCIHMIPIVRQLEERFPNELVVIGVHSAKFENEGQTENLRQIVERYDISHPVINDVGFIVWRSFQASAWPTFMVVDPNGNIVAAQAGEVPFEAFETYLAAMIDYYDANPYFGEINRTLLEFALEGAGDPGTALAFPGKVLVDSANNRLFIADTNHHRIVVTDLATHEVLATIGNGERGYADGSYSEARFDQPQGMEILGDMLYVADVNNHAIRAIDLSAETVATIAGTGRMGTSFTPFDYVVRDPLAYDLRSPWDLALGADNTLYIAMAGTHQVWQINLDTNELRPAVGTGQEAQISSSPSSSALAQPSGLYYHEGLLYIADSESSTVRVADFAEDRVRLIAGTPNNDLFDFGDVDGAEGTSRLQHALGVTGNEDASLIYIADTYNSRIKVYDTSTGETQSIFGLGGNGGYRDGDASVAEFDEPGGLDYADGKLYVADTNNHVIRLIDLEAGTVETLQFTNPEALVIERAEPTILGGNSAEGLEITLDAQNAAVGEGEIVIQFRLPEGYKINELTESSLDVSSDTESVAFEQSHYSIEESTVSISATFSAGESTITLNSTLFYCLEDSYCLIDEAIIHVPVLVDEAGESSISIEREVLLPEGLD
jgi:DNA-binding beta-propeller fold protein YncE